MDELFLGKLSKEYCLYFYIIMVIQLVFLSLSVIGFLFFIINFKKVTLISLINQMGVLFVLFLGYLQSRILYSMCNNSLN